MDSAVKKYADEQLREAYKLCYLPLIKYCNVRMGDARISADDCVQEAFIVFYNKLLSGEHIENPRAYLYRTVDNFVKRAVAQYARDTKHNLPLETAQELTVPELPFNAENLDYDLLAKELLNMLSEQEQRLYNLKYIERLPLSEIAKILEISPTAAAKRTSRLRKEIKDKLVDFIERQEEGGI